MNIKEELEKFVPPSEILKRAGGRGVEYSYVDRFYVISTLTRIFGDEWGSTMSVSVMHDRVVATCSLDTVLGRRTDTGESLLVDNKGRPNENAATEAASQAFKRAASQLGNAFGLHLYREGKPPTPMAQPSSPPAQVAQVAQAVATPQVVAGTLTKPDYQGAIQSAMANAEASAPPPVQQQQSGPQVDLDRLAGCRADVTVWETHQGDRGIPLGDLDEGNLIKYVEGYGKNLAKNPNPKYAEKNQAHLANIKYCVQYAHIGDMVQEHAQPQRQGESWPTDADNPMDNADIPF